MIARTENVLRHCLKTASDGAAVSNNPNRQPSCLIQQQNSLNPLLFFLQLTHCQKLITELDM